MKTARIILVMFAALAIVLGGLYGPVAAAQEQIEKPAQPAKPKPPMEFKTLDTDKVRKMPAPGEEAKTSFDGKDMDPHQRMARFVGTWDVQGRFWIAPDAEPVTGVGTAIAEMDLEGQFLHTRFKGELMGETFVGVGYETWDEARGKYSGVWMDSRQPEIMSYEGEWDESGNVLTVYGQRFDPEKKKTFKTRGVTTFRSSSMYTFESAFQNEAGEWVTVMQAIFGKL